MTKILVLILMALMVLTEYLDAQNAIVPVGTDVKGQTDKISYTVGQIAYHQFTSLAGSVNEGVQQVFKDSIVNSFEVDPGLNPVFNIYPNPVAGLLTIEKSCDSSVPFTYKLFSPELKLVGYGSLPEKHTCFVTEGILPGVHFLVILKDGIMYTVSRIVIIK